MGQTVKQHDPMAGAVSENYATALFDLAEADNQTQAIAEELAGLVEILGQHDDLTKVLAHRAIETGRRASTIRTLFEGNVSDLLLRFLLVLNDKNRLDRLAAIQQTFDRLLKTKRNEIDVDIFTATPLDERKRTEIARQLTKALKKTALIRDHVDPSLVGGLKIRLGDQLVDGSVAAQLRRMAREITQASHQAARTRGNDLMESE